ncbi:unnamed protein product, partial [Mesorhabditis belari]|uniref:Carbonic anhydrase n=1 Tax=Mesorhabditis belari TaxID=2138241 RepID=A0AAF3J294_9BILA
MAFLSQLQGKFQNLKETAQNFTEQGALGAHLQSIKEGAPKLLNQAKSAKDELLNKVKLDSIGKVLHVTSLGRNQSPIDIVPVITAFGENLQNAEFRVEYHDHGEFKAINTGATIMIEREGNDSELALSFWPEEQFHLDAVSWHWGTEPMNGSEHTIGGVGYAGEMHLIHRNTRFSTMDLALKQPNGVVIVAIFLNESHDDNPALNPFIEILPKIVYKGNETKISHYNFNQLFPALEKCKEFWVYDGSETVDPFRETVKWIVLRSAQPISSRQLDKLREVKGGGYDEENERQMQPIRSTQQHNNRTILSSFRSAASQPNLGFNQ